MTSVSKPLRCEPRSRRDEPSLSSVAGSKYRGKAPTGNQNPSVSLDHVSTFVMCEFPSKTFTSSPLRRSSDLLYAPRWELPL